MKDSSTHHSGDISRLKTRLTELFVWLIVAGTALIMAVTLMLISQVPQAAVLSVFGEQTIGTLGEEKSVRYASFPYDGVIRAVTFQSADGQWHQLERGGDYVPIELGDYPTVSYLPAYPKIALLVAEPRVRYWLFGFGLMVLLLFCLMLALAEDSGNRCPLLLRPLLPAGNLLLTVLEWADQAWRKRSNLPDE